MADPEYEDPEGTEPFEEAGPAKAVARIEQCSVTMDDLSASGPNELQVPFFQEIVDAHVPETIVLITSPVDGMPVPANESNKPADAPSLSIETMVCVEDDRQYVELFAEEVDWLPGVATLLRKLFESYPKPDRLALGSRSMWAFDGLERERLSFEPSRLTRLFGQTMVELDEAERMSLGIESEGGKRRLLLVRPVRERCRFYRRQVVNLPGDDERKMMYRNCTERRTIGGAFLSLDDQAMYACEYRSPPDPVSTQKHIVEKDYERMRRMAKSDAEKAALAETGDEDIDIPDVAPQFFGGDFGVQ